MSEDYAPSTAQHAQAAKSLQPAKSTLSDKSTTQSARQVIAANKKLSLRIFAVIVLFMLQLYIMTDSLSLYMSEADVEGMLWSNLALSGGLFIVALVIMWRK